MKFAFIIPAAIVLILVLFWWYRIMFPGSKPQAGKPPRAVTPEQLNIDRWDFTIGLGAWLISFFTGGSLVLYGLVTLPYSSSFETVDFTLMIVPLSIAGLGALVLLAGRVWYSIALFRIVRDLWGGCSDCNRRRPGTFWGWIAIIPVFGAISVLILWLGQSRIPTWFRLLWGFVGVLAWCALLGAAILSWWLWIGFYVWMPITFAFATTAASRPGLTPPLPHTVRRRYRRQIVVPAIVLLISVGGWLMLKIHIDRSVARAEQRIAGYGVPTTPEGMHALFPMPENNAYSLYLELDAEQKEHPGSPLGDFGSPGATELYRMPSLPPELESKLTAWQKDREPLAKLLDRLNPAQPMQFPRVWESTFSMRIPEIQMVRKLAQYECFRFDRARRAGDTAEMQKLWQQMQTLREWVRDDGILISGFVAIAIGDMQFLSLEAMLNAVPLSDAELRALMLQLRNDEKAQYADWRLGFVGEAFCNSYALRPETMAAFLKNQPGKDRPSKNVREMLQQKFTNSFAFMWLLQSNRAFSLNYYAELIDLAPLDYYQAQQPSQALEATLKHLPLYQVLSRMLLPALSHSGQANAQEIARLRVMRTAIAAELYRRKHGAWPERLTDLVPEFLDAVPVDPFDGQPLRCRQGKLETFELGLKPGETASTPPPSDPTFESDETVAIPQFQPIPAAKFIREYRPVTRSGFRIYSIGRDKIDSGGSSRRNDYRNANTTGSGWPAPPRQPEDDISFILYDSTLEKSR